MARPQEFDTQTVLDKALTVFWKKGFNDASIQDLVDATGLNRGSLYNAFGDKSQFFAAVMDHYLSASPTHVFKTAGNDVSVHQQFRDFFDTLVARADEDRDHKGCLMTNTAAGLYGCDAAMREAIGKMLVDFENLLTEVIERGQRSGELTTTQPPRQLARFFVSVAQGLNVMARANPQSGCLQDVAVQALRVLD